MISRSGNDEFLRRMEISARKRSQWQRVVSQGIAEEDPFVWTIADIVTLLLIFFILLYTNASSHAKPAQPVSRPKTAVATPPDPEYQQLRQEVDRFMAQSEDQGFTVRWDQTRPVFVLGERITFPQGQADLRESFQPALRRIAVFIATHPGYQIMISGHTDDTPIDTPAYPSNWELSAARAARVARFLIENGIDPQLVAIHGYAQYSPLNENSTSEQREANRRVEITLMRVPG